MVCGHWIDIIFTISEVVSVLLKAVHYKLRSLGPPPKLTEQMTYHWNDIYSPLVAPIFLVISALPI